MNSNINLLGNKNHDAVQPASRKLRILRGIAIGLLFCVSGAAIILYILISFSALPQAQEREALARQSIAQSHADMTKIALLKDRLDGVTMITKNRNKYDEFLDKLVSRMPAGMTIEQVSMSKKNASVTVKSVSVDELNAFLKQLVDASETEKEYSQVTLNAITSDDITNIFSMTISFVLP